MSDSWLVRGETPGGGGGGGGDGGDGGNGGGGTGGDDGGTESAYVPPTGSTIAKAPQRAPSPYSETIARCRLSLR